MYGLYGKTHFDLEEFIDLSVFDELHLDIIKGISIAKPIALNGYLVPHSIYEDEDLSYKLHYKPLMDAYQYFLNLPESDPIKIEGIKIKAEHGYNALAMFLKYYYGAHDLLSHYMFWDHYSGWRENTNHRKLTTVAQHFPTLIEWIDQLKDVVFSNIGRAYLITIDSNGYSFEHRDPPLDPDNVSKKAPEFIHIRPNLKRPFYVYDSEKKEKHYLKNRIGWWNDRDIHGGEVILEPSYAIRIDGLFTDDFRRKIGIL